MLLAINFAAHLNFLKPLVCKRTHGKQATRPTVASPTAQQRLRFLLPLLEHVE